MNMLDKSIGFLMVIVSVLALVVVFNEVKDTKQVVLNVVTQLQGEN